MKGLHYLKSALVGGASALAIASPASATVFDIPTGDLSAALNTYIQQSGVHLIYMDQSVRGHRSPGAKGDYSETAALTQVLRGTGFTTVTMPSNAIGIVPAPEQAKKKGENVQLAAAAPTQSGMETVVVTAQHKQENIQQVPIAVTALSQQQLTERQIAGGPDLLREVPNMDFTKTNFSGYNIELRGIGTQAISVTTDPAVAVAFNDTPFIRNHFFEQEFFDLSDAEVLRGPQGTLYGRNATAGVVNIKSALPTDTYEAMMSADVGNYNNRRLEGMLNLPLDGDKLDLRIAGEWTKRDGYTDDTTLNAAVDGRDLWSGRLTLGWKPTSDLQTYLVWEHFSEDDDRLRSGKQLCDTASTPTEVDGVAVPGSLGSAVAYDPVHYLDQGCVGGSLYAPSAFGVPDGKTLPYYFGLCPIYTPLTGCSDTTFDPYAGTTQSTNLRQIQAAFDPTYRAKNDTLEYNATWNISKALTFTSQTGYNHDFLWSNEDYNRFDTTPGAFTFAGYNTVGCCENGLLLPDPLAGTTVGGIAVPSTSGVFCDPQIGCSDRVVAEDLDVEHAWQFSQEFRLASDFDGPLNFSAGGNYLHYETVENYYVFVNTLTLEQATPWQQSQFDPNTLMPWVPGVTDNSFCLPQGFAYVNPHLPHNPLSADCGYIDPNPLGSLDNEGHNYFLSQNPYVLNSYALFGELYYDIEPDLKLTLGARWTEDEKHFIDIPSELLEPGYGYPVTAVVNQRWDAPTGRAVLDWTPNLDFTDQTLVYGSYAHGYKAGGANPPGAALLSFESGDITFPDHPLTFKPEYIDAFELGTKNTLLDNSLTVDGDIFYYAYTGYQISEIVDRSAINNNYNASVKGAELEANWEPTPGLKFGFTGGWEDATANHGDNGIDLMDRTAGMPGWMVIKPFPTQASNCILPDYVVAALLEANPFADVLPNETLGNACGLAYNQHVDPITGLPYSQPYPTQCVSTGCVIPPGYPGFDPVSPTALNTDPFTGKNAGPAPNNGEGFTKNLSGNQLPNAPHFTTSLTGEYTVPVWDDWAATFHTDFYWQSQSWARIFNDNPYDKLRGYSNVNVSLILNSANGWQVMAYVKNVFNVTAITGTFLNSDDSGLTTNVFLTDPQLFGIRVTKQLDRDDGFWGSDYSGYDFFTNLFSDTDNGKPQLWIELGGNFDQLADGHRVFDPPFMSTIPSKYPSQLSTQKAPALGLDWQGAVSFDPNQSEWEFTASIRYGRSSSNRHEHPQTEDTKPFVKGVLSHYPSFLKNLYMPPRYVESTAGDSETHAIIDFLAGRNVGLGSLGLPGTAVLSGGARYVAFTSRSGFNIDTTPDAAFHPTASLPKYDFHRDHGTFEAERSFHGIGPTVDLKAATALLGNEQTGQWTLDWGFNGAVLFGRQKAAGMHQTGGALYCSNHFGAYVGRTAACPAPTANALATAHGYRQISHYQRTKSFNRSRMVTVPNIGAFAGLSMRFNNAKVSFGYRADEFFGAMDGGIDSYKAENRGFFGPFANISIGIGG